MTLNTYQFMQKNMRKRRRSTTTVDIIVIVVIHLSTLSMLFILAMLFDVKQVTLTNQRRIEYFSAVIP